MKTNLKKCTFYLKIFHDININNRIPPAQPLYPSSEEVEMLMHLKVTTIIVVVIMAKATETKMAAIAAAVVEKTTEAAIIAPATTSTIDFLFPIESSCDTQ